jgi:hypothetical protein
MYLAYSMKDGIPNFKYGNSNKDRKGDYMGNTDIYEKSDRRF